MHVFMGNRKKEERAEQVTATGEWLEGQGGEPQASTAHRSTTGSTDEFCHLCGSEEACDTQSKLVTLRLAVGEL